MSRAWDKEKIWDSDRIRTYDLPNTGRALFVHFSYEELMESDAIYIYIYIYIYILGSYLTHVQHTARISNVDVALCGEKMKDGKFLSSKKQIWNELISMSRAGDKERIWDPIRIRTYDLPNTGRALYPLELRRTHGEQGHILGSYLTRVLLTARISNVDVVLCGERMFAGRFAGRENSNFSTLDIICGQRPFVAVKRDLFSPSTNLLECRLQSNL